LGLVTPTALLTKYLQNQMLRCADSESAMPTIVDLLANYLVPRFESVTLEAGCERFRESLIGLRDAFGALVASSGRCRESLIRLGEPIDRLIFFVANSRPSVGYEPLLCEGGYPRAIARAFAMLTFRIGKRRAKEGKRQTEVFSAFRFLAKPHRRPDAIARRAKILIAAWQETSILEALLDKVGIHVSELLSLLDDAARSVSHEYLRLQEIANRVVRSQSLPMGPKRTAQSISMEYFLRHFPRHSNGPQAFGQKHPDRDSDLVAEATRREFGLSQFDGRPARRRIKRAIKPN
jgi:hypothetical protein